MTYSSETLRKKFINYFVRNGHKEFKSDSLIPKSDPTLLFTSAGMVQFKKYFIKREIFASAVSCQKCLRTSDIDEIGYTSRHLSFFEMLGNFSFGDYFKREAIYYGWEFLIKELNLPVEKIYITVYKDDDEAYNEWKKYVSETKIYRLDEKTNFWTMGPTGPCGPCSEMIYDLGQEYGCGRPDCNPGCSCNRWIEIWNLVFTQFDRQQDGSLIPLKQKNIDTGMGLERLTAICNNKISVFETDILQLLIKKICEIANYEYNTNTKNDIAVRIIADHLRAITFLIADNILPSNEGRGYVLRRFIRRAVRQNKLLNLNKPLLYKLVNEVIDNMKNIYPELYHNREMISIVVKTEEEKFLETLDSGLSILNELIQKTKKENKNIISGKNVFYLYDTYGFPEELTKEILKENKLDYDKNEFDYIKQNAIEIAKQSWKGVNIQDISVYEKFEKTKFVGYEKLEVKSIIKGIIKDNIEVDTINEKEQGEIILDITPFYAESGGQVGDKGVIKSDNTKTEIIAEVINTTKPIENVFVHKVIVKKGHLKLNQSVISSVDKELRKATERHHTATHILHKALREILGTHVRQSGSLVAPDRFRFDFTHFKELSDIDKENIEQKVNNIIMSCLPVTIIETSYKKAEQWNPMALFGEKYGDIVRCVIIGGKFCMNTSTGEQELVEIPESIELCGGTHCKNTGEIGIFKILSESSIGTGYRRIEAICGDLVRKYINKNDKLISELSIKIKSNPTELIQKIDKILETQKQMQNEINLLKEKILTGSIDTDKILIKKISIEKNSFKINDLNIIIQKVENISIANLRNLNDKLKNKYKTNSIIIVVNITEDKVNIILGITKDIINIISADVLLKEIVKNYNGSCGGRKDFAQGGWKKIKEINLEELFNIVKQSLK